MYKSRSSLPHPSDNIKRRGSLIRTFLFIRTFLCKSPIPLTIINSNMHVSILLFLSLTTVATARTSATWAWSSLGCFVDGPNRLLGSVFMVDIFGQTVERCLARCNGYKYALVENGRYVFSTPLCSPSSAPPNLWKQRVLLRKCYQQRNIDRDQ